jgi:undecaprenyl-diphosphatase
MDRGATALADVSLKQALVVGTCQVVALVPGVSRSGTTIFAGLLSGMNRHTAATFSFLVAIPVIAGAATLEAWKILREGRVSQAEWGMYGLGALVSAVVGLLALKGLLKVISARKLHMFAWYCLAMGGLVITLSVMGHLQN